MKRTSILFCLLFAIAANLFIAAKAQVNTTDSLALVDLYNSTNGPKWKHHTNWLTATPVSTWLGITVTNNRVTKIVLPQNHMSGTLPASIGNLTNLTDLFLYDNQLRGTIPSSLGNLINLTDLNLPYNQLSGTIPSSLGNLINLTSVGLGYNQLSGTIPSSLGNLINLTELGLNNNQLTGTIPAFIGNLINLDGLFLNNNKLTGAIPNKIGNLIYLTNLQLQSNQLTGTIPSEIGNLIKLFYVDLSYNGLTSTLPVTLGNLVNLKYLELENNKLSGSIPASFKNFENLYEINLSYNLLSQSGEIHSSIATNNASVNINNNLFTFDGLQILIKHYNRISYAPQDTILPIHQNGNALSVSAGGTLSNNTYTWYKLGDTSKTIIKKDSTFKPSQSGRYYARVTNAIVTQPRPYYTDLILTTDTVTYTLVSTVQNRIANTTAIKASNHFFVYPNPAKDIVYVQVKGTATIVLTNTAGKILLSKTINNSDVINLSAYANGTYYLQNKTTGETQKIIVVH